MGVTYVLSLRAFAGYMGTEFTSVAWFTLVAKFFACAKLCYVSLNFLGGLNFVMWVIFTTSVK